LQYALRQVLGEHVQQRGSLVEPARLRFDFSHLASLTGEEISKIQEIVNHEIRHNHPVLDKQMSYKEAVASGAIALFDEKYGDVVRALSVGQPPISTELCGGTHVSATGEIGLFEITTETSIGSGLRRIEAVTGRQALVENQNRTNILKTLANLLDTTPSSLLSKTQILVNRTKEIEKRIESMEREEALKAIPSLTNRAIDFGGMKLLSARVEPCRPETLGEMADRLREKLGSAVVVLGTISDDKPYFVVTVSSDLTAKGYNAGSIIRQVAAITGGGGGGKPDHAQGGGKELSRLDEAIAAVPVILQKK
jgi:alanyl-tRNA synthetase